MTIGTCPSRSSAGGSGTAGLERMASGTTPTVQFLGPVWPSWTLSPHRDGASWLLGSHYHNFRNWPYPFQASSPHVQSLLMSRSHSHTASFAFEGPTNAGCADYRAQSYKDAMQSVVHGLS